MNLTAITEFDDVMKKHFTDSLSLVKAYSEIRTEKLKVIDIGTGAGFPGIPLKIVFPQIELTLLDSLQKLIIFQKLFFLCIAQCDLKLFQIFFKLA